MIVNYSTESKILELFAKEKVIARNLGLASITIKLPPENTKISGTE